MDLDEAITREVSIAEVAETSLIKLTDHVGPAPANLTPEMLAWYNIHVRPSRKAALDAVGAEFDAMSKGKNAGGIFRERQHDAVDDECLRAKRTALAAHQQKYGAKLVELQQARREEDTARIRYENLEVRHNRAPKLPDWWYVPALALLLPAEGAINFESFMALKWMTPAIALGTVIVLGVVLALSAHLYGTLVRQARVLFDPAQDDIDRLVGWRMLGFGTLALAIVLSAVWYARAAYFADMLQTSDFLGGQAPSSVMIVGGSMLGNLAVWVGGVILAFLVHDPDPNFPKSLQDWRAKSRRAQQLQEGVDSALQRDFEQIDAIAKRKREEVDNHVRATSHMLDYQEARRSLSRVVEQDARVLALLNAYRGKLITAMRGLDVRFEKWRPVGIESTEFLTGSQYAAEPLVLKYL